MECVFGAHAPAIHPFTGSGTVDEIAAAQPPGSGRELRQAEADLLLASAEDAIFSSGDRSALALPEPHHRAWTSRCSELQHRMDIPSAPAAPAAGTAANSARSVRGAGVGNPAVRALGDVHRQCPSDYAMLCPKAGKIDAYEASSPRRDALASAEKAISSAASFVLPGLKAAFVAYTEARRAEDAGDVATALEKYGAALKGAASVLDPCHEPLAAETLEWAGTVWAESLFASNLAVAGADFDQFGECGGGQALEEGKVVELPRVTLLKPTVDGAHASGRWEDDVGAAAPSS